MRANAHFLASEQGFLGWRERDHKVKQRLEKAVIEVGGIVEVRWRHIFIDRMAIGSLNNA